MAQDSYVQIAPDSTGKQIDAAALPNTSGNTVYRQTIAIGDPSNISAVLSIDASGLLQNSGQRDGLATFLAQQRFQALDAQSANGFVPLEIPSFLAGV